MQKIAQGCPFKLQGLTIMLCVTFTPPLSTMDFPMSHSYNFFGPIHLQEGNITYICLSLIAHKWKTIMFASRFDNEVAKLCRPQINLTLYVHVQCDPLDITIMN